MPSRPLQLRAVLVAAVASVSLLGASAAQLAQPEAAQAKRCSDPWVHASLPWGHKCVIRAQNCKPKGDGMYHRYGFHCHTGRLRKR